jgi:protein TonB
LFDQTFVNAHAQTRRPWTVAISLALQTLLIAIALIAPLLHIATLEVPQNIPVWVPVQKLDLKMKPEVKESHSAPAAQRPVFHLAALQAPTIVPRNIDMTPDAPEIANAFAPTGLAGTSIREILPEIAIPPAPKPITPPAPVRPPSAVRVGGGVQSAKLIFGPRPGYPPLARAARTQGAVRMQATIARDGSIRNLQLVSGPPLLVAAAIGAVQRWRYQPTLLNGEPVEVITEIDVNFTLSQ